MTLASVLADGRAAAEARMVDACIIGTPGARPTFDDVTETYTFPAGAQIYAGPCEVQASDTLDASTPEAGGTVATVVRLTLKVPMDVDGIREDQVVAITASVHDPDLVGRKFRVASWFGKSHATARRLQVEETSS